MLRNRKKPRRGRIPQAGLFCCLLTANKSKAGENLPGSLSSYVQVNATRDSAYLGNLAAHRAVVDESGNPTIRHYSPSAPTGIVPARSVHDDAPWAIRYRIEVAVCTLIAWPNPNVLEIVQLHLVTTILPSALIATEGRQRTACTPDVHGDVDVTLRCGLNRRQPNTEWIDKQTDHEQGQQQRCNTCFQGYVILF